jgi:hypothetical protein
LQLIDLPAAIALVPALALIATISAGGYVKAHWLAAGSLPVGEVRDRFRFTVPPCGAVPEASSNWLPAPKTELHANVKMPTTMHPRTKRDGGMSLTKKVRINGEPFRPVNLIGQNHWSFKYAT